MVMSRLASRQYGAGGSDYYNTVGGSGVRVSGSVGASALGSDVSVGGSARVTGVVVLIALAVALIGYHGLRVV